MKLGQHRLKVLGVPLYELFNGLDLGPVFDAEQWFCALALFGVEAGYALHLVPIQPGCDCLAGRAVNLCYGLYFVALAVEEKVMAAFTENSLFAVPVAMLKLFLLFSRQLDVSVLRLS